MRHPIQAGLLIATATLLLSGRALAGTSLSLSFTGVASAGFSGSIFQYVGASPPPVSFEGQPVRIDLSIADYATTPFVDSFSVSWTDQTFTLPYLTRWTGSGILQTNENDSLATFFSTVDLSAAGGSITIFPSSGFVATTDGGFTLALNYVTGAMHPVGSSFSDSVTGSGSADGGVNLNFDSVIGPFDAHSGGGFTLSGVTATAVPEPAAWGLMTVGFLMLGAAIRRPRRRAAVLTSA